MADMEGITTKMNEMLRNFGINEDNFKNYILQTVPRTDAQPLQPPTHSASEIVIRGIPENTSHEKIALAFGGGDAVRLVSVNEGLTFVQFQTKMLAVNGKSWSNIKLARYGMSDTRSQWARFRQENMHGNWTHNVNGRRVSTTPYDLVDYQDWSESFGIDEDDYKNYIPQRVPRTEAQTELQTTGSAAAPAPA